ncbi:MAG TPA: hypothetical protein PKJ97_03850 [Candidatus Bilamarchaeaceae archaeon]|nr:hypothetical protein [Candidatus Bilamarchaeaceae archaeon]
MKKQMLLMGVLLLAGLSFAQLPPILDPFMDQKQWNGYCGYAGMYSLLEYAEVWFCTAPDFSDEKDALEAADIANGNAALEGNLCFNGAVDQMCLRQARSNFMGIYRNGNSAMQGANAALRVAVRDELANGCTTPEEMKNAWRGYWAFRINCLREGRPEPPGPI